MKKTLNLVMGAFLICSVLIPLIGAVSAFSCDYNPESENVTFSEDYTQMYEKEVLNETAKNLVKATNDLLISENINAENIEVSIKKSDNDSIYISRINIYIAQTDKEKIDLIKRTVEKNMSKEPVVIVNE